MAGRYHPPKCDADPGDEHYSNGVCGNVLLQVQNEHCRGSLKAAQVKNHYVVKFCTAYKKKYSILKEN